MKKLSPKGYEKLIRLFQSLSGARSLWESFNDCINLFSLSFQNFTELGDAFRKNEEEYKQIIGRYKKTACLRISVFLVVCLTELLDFVGKS